VSSIGNGREPGASLLSDVEGAAPGERRPRARRPSHGESFASALEEQVVKTPARPHKPGVRGTGERDASGSSATAVVLAAAAAQPLAPPVPAARGTFDRMPTARALTPLANVDANTNANANESAPVVALAQADADAGAVPVALADDADTTRMRSATPSLPPVDGHDTEPAPIAAKAAADAANATPPTTIPPRTRDTLPDVPAPPARAVSAADLSRIHVGDLPRLTRDTSAPLGEPDGAHAASASAASVLVSHASGAHTNSTTSSAKSLPTPTIPPPALAESEHADRPHGVVGKDGADLRLGDGDDALSLRITADRHMVHVHATAADAGLAEALRASADELRQALGAHGLELGELTTTTTGSGSGGPGSDAPDGAPGDSAAPGSPREPKPTRRRGWVA